MDVGAALRELDARLLACVVEQAQLDAGRHVAEDREVRAGAVVGRPERIGTTGPDVLTLGGHAAPCWRPADELLGDGFTLSAARAQPCREPGEAPVSVSRVGPSEPREAPGRDSVTPGQVVAVRRRKPYRSNTAASDAGLLKITVDDVLAALAALADL